MKIKMIDGRIKFNEVDQGTKQDVIANWPDYAAAIEPMNDGDEVEV